MKKLFDAAAILCLMFAHATAVRADAAPFDVIERSYRPYMRAGDPLSFPLKIRSIASDEYKFWRGSKDLFYLWTKDACADWLSDTGSFQPTHGDLHLGNIGSYASEAGWGKLAFGMVDFDDSARVPFQFELLQGLVTLHLTAEHNSINLDDELKRRLLTTLVSNYKRSLNSRSSSTDALANDSIVKALLMRSGRGYAEELEGFTEGGKFRKSVMTGGGKVKEILRAADSEAAGLCAAIAAAAENSEDFKALLRYASAADIGKNFKGAAIRSRLNSSGSQGLKKYLVLLTRPMKGVESDVIFYLKQEIPSAAERAGVISPDPRPAGRRTSEDMSGMTDPLPLANSWGSVGAESYWVTIKEPWSDELDPDTVKTPDDLIHMATIWGIVAGSTHRETGHGEVGRFNVILPKLTTSLEATLATRTGDFLLRLKADFAAFKADDRTKAQLKLADDAIEAAAK